MSTRDRDDDAWKGEALIRGQRYAHQGRGVVAEPRTRETDDVDRSRDRPWNMTLDCRRRPS